MTWRAPVHYVVDGVPSSGTYVVDDEAKTGELYGG